MNAADTRAALARLAQAPPMERRRLVAKLPLKDLLVLDEWWEQWAHDGQYWPGGDWRVWLIQAGRGFGKTRAGAEWVLHMARAHAGCRFALVSANAEDVRRVMVEGPAGLIACARDDEPLVWRKDAGTLTLPGGGMATLYSACAPEGLRGPEHDFAWCDELGKWGQGGEAAWDNLMLGLRLGDAPRVLVTTTPRKTKLMRRLRAMPGLVETKGSTRDNPHLPASFVQAMIAEYGGTRLGRQELDGELIEDIEDALWPRALIEGCRVSQAPELARVVVGVDPPATSGGDACGIVAVGLGEDGHGYVLADASVRGASPERWSRAVMRCAKKWRADRVIAEVNQGGDMVKSLLSAADASIGVSAVRATRGKTNSSKTGITRSMTSTRRMKAPMPIARPRA